MARLTKEKLNTLLEKQDIDIFTFISDRGGWKTTTVQIELIERALTQNQTFVLVRSKKDEYITSSWFSEYTREYFKNKDIRFYTENVNPNIVKISALRAGSDEQITIFFGVWLSLAEKYKSNYFSGFERVRFLVWEECVPNKPLPQNIKNIKANFSEQLISIMSIGSTIARRNRVQYIFLGNDIKTNIINPVTVNFGVLERLAPNCEIYDTCEIDDRKYNYYFNYFDFEGAVNHWLVNSEADITYNLPVKNEKAFTYILKSEFKTYYLYFLNSFFYVTEQKPDGKLSVINNEREFFEYFGYAELLDKYESPELALNILFTLAGGEVRENILKYFGSITSPKFRKIFDSYENSVINLFELSEMSYSKILNSANISDIRNFVNMLKNSTFIYSNVYIKLLCEYLY